jgi:hypothetical protein
VSGSSKMCWGPCKISKDPAGNQTQNLSCCSAVPQPNSLLVTYEKYAKKNFKIGTLHRSHFE